MLRDEPFRPQVHFAIQYDALADGKPPLVELNDTFGVATAALAFAYPTKLLFPTLNAARLPSTVTVAILLKLPLNCVGPPLAH